METGKTAYKKAEKAVKKAIRNAKKAYVKLQDRGNKVVTTRWQFLLILKFDQ